MPTPQINWFKDGFEVFSSRRAKIINDHGSSTLIFHQVALTDEGEIKCTATNKFGHVVTRFFLRIEAPPKIRLPRQYEDGFLVEAGEVIKLKVGTAGRPIPAISWCHNNEIIKNGGRYEIITTEKNSFLKIVKVTRNDRGEYNIRAINKLGEFNASFLVTVTAKPSPPQNLRITMSLGKSVTLSWNPPSDGCTQNICINVLCLLFIYGFFFFIIILFKDGGCKIGNYIVEYFRIGWDVWLKASSTRQLSATLNDLIEGSEYKFRVKAESPYGLSEPSEDSKILFIPDHKRGIVTPTSERSTRVGKGLTLSPNSIRKENSEKTTKITKTNVNQIIIPDIPKNVELISQVYDNEAIVNEMNYGTTADRVSKKRESFKISRLEQHQSQQQQPQNMKNKQILSDTNNYRAIETRSKQLTTDNQKSNQTNYIAPNKIQSTNDNSKNKFASTPDEVHNSNEFMLVLYDNKKENKETEESNIHFSNMKN